jgi:DNA-binding transcriptional LysR family regulator
MNNSNALVSAEKLDSDLLRTFIAIADTGSFTRGADRLFRSQSAVSLQIKRLETTLGKPVFERRARGIVLTPIGEKLRPVAQRIVNLLDITIGELRGEALAGSIRIGIPDEYGETVLPSVIASFVREHPQVELGVRCGFSASFPEALAQNELDLAVYSAELPDANSLLLRKEKTCWVRAANHQAHEQDPLPVALFDRECWWRDRALEALEISGRRYRVVYTSESVMGVMAAISAGVAVGLVSESVVNAGMKILTRADGLPSIPSSALVISRRAGVDSQIADAMTEAIVAAFR